MSNYRLLVAYFSREDDSLVGEYPLEMNEARLRQLLGLRADEPLTENYPITEAQRSAIETATNTRIDLDAYFYFVASRAT